MEVAAAVGEGVELVDGVGDGMEASATGEAVAVGAGFGAEQDADKRTNEIINAIKTLLLTQAPLIGRFEIQVIGNDNASQITVRADS